MGTTTFLKFLILALMVMELYPKVEGQIWVPRAPPIPPVIPPPLCASQLALVNHACAQLPYMPYPPPYEPSPTSEPPTPTPTPEPPAPTPEPPTPTLTTLTPPPPPTPVPPPPTPIPPPPPPPTPIPPPPPPPTPIHVPPTPIPVPPTPPSPDSSEDSHRHHHHRHHHHTPSSDGSDDIHQLQRLRFSDSATLSVTQAECCKWLKEVDNVCVCDVLVHLPPFLTRPIHNYTVYVDETCHVTFSCGSRLVQI